MRVCWCCIAAAAAAAAVTVAVLLCGCYINSEELWVGIVQLGFRMARTHTPHAEAPFVAVTKRKP